MKFEVAQQGERWVVSRRGDPIAIFPSRTEALGHVAHRLRQFGSSASASLSLRFDRVQPVALAASVPGGGGSHGDRSPGIALDEWLARTMKLTPQACRAGRALLGWSLGDLAREADLSFPTLRRLEAGGHIYPATAAKIGAAFIRNGIVLADAPLHGGLQARRLF